MRWSEAAKPEYQNFRRSAAASGGAPPGLKYRARAIMTKMRETPRSVAGRATLVLEALAADPSGPEADCERLPPVPGEVLGDAGLPALGTSGVALAGAVVLGARSFIIPAIEVGAA